MSGKFMVYCPKCGEELPEEAAFCPKCGRRTGEPLEEGVSLPMDELRKGLAEAGEEIEKALQVAAKEIDKAFRTARENIREQTRGRTVACPDCGEKNPDYAKFCYSCGKALEK
jgi:predicted amidophosphoribosyltransferase